MLIKNGADILAKTNDGHCALHVTKSPDIVRELLHHWLAATSASPGSTASLTATPAPVAATDTNKSISLDPATDATTATATTQSGGKIDNFVSQYFVSYKSGPATEMNE